LGNVETSLERPEDSEDLPIEQRRSLQRRMAASAENQQRAGTLVPEGGPSR
jgi:hypothetical protein